jgi:hypothetical protein
VRSTIDIIHTNGPLRMGVPLSACILQKLRRAYPRPTRLSQCETRRGHTQRTPPYDPAGSGSYLYSLLHHADGLARMAPVVAGRQCGRQAVQTVHAAHSVFMTG